MPAWLISAASGSDVRIQDISGEAHTRPYLAQRDCVRSNGALLIVQDGRTAHVWWHPELTRPDVFGASLFVTSDLEPLRLHLSTFSKSWQSSLHRNVDALRISMLTIYERNCRPNCSANRFAARRHQIGDYASNAPLSSILHFSLSRQLRFDDRMLKTLASTLAGDRYTLIEPTHGSSELIVHEWSGFPVYGHFWNGHSRGLRFEDQPDVLYGKSSALAFREALISQVPVLESVEATIWRPAVGDVRRSFTRLVLPIRVSNRRTMLWSTSVDNKLLVQPVSEDKYDSKSPRHSCPVIIPTTPR
jgi:hypothetical protein